MTTRTTTISHDHGRLAQERAAGTHAAAFTLTEMVVTLAIVAIVSAIALPRFGSSLVSVRLDNAARRIARDFELARRSARAQSKSVTMTFNLAAESYGIAGVPSLESSQRDYHVEVEREYDGVQIQAANFGGLQTVTFSGYGVPDNGGSVTLILAGISRSIVVYPETGLAETF